jgi:peptidoglycan/LPS O-acetylase OafA/YrhL
MTANKQNYLVLDLMRGIAALFVFLGHSRAIMFTDANAGNVSGIVAKSFYFLTGFGHESVIIFFVLSGFVIAKSIDNDLQKKKWSFRNYLFNRISRLWVVLLPALILGGIFDAIGLSLFPTQISYTGKLPFLPDVAPMSRLGVSVFLGNLFFIQNIVTTTWGSNGPLWSLANEFWYYLLYPLFLSAIIIPYKTIYKIVAVVCFALIAYFVGWGIFSYFSIWLIGVAAFYIKKIKKHLMRTQIAAVVLLIIILGGIRLKWNATIFNDYSLGIATGFFVWNFAKYYSLGTIGNKVTIFLSNISYTLYLVHLPFLLFFCSLLHYVQIPFTLLHFALWTVLIIATILYAYIMWFLFERNTNKIKQYCIQFKNKISYAKH